MLTDERWQPLFELTVRSYYEGAMEAGRWACERALSLPDLPDDVECQIRWNQVFYAQPLRDVVESVHFSTVNFPVAPGRTIFNPSISASGTGYCIVARSSNYTIAPDSGSYIVGDDDGVIRTQNYLLDLDRDFHLIAVRELRDSTDPSCKGQFPVRGFEDCRLVRHGDAWYLSATTREHNQAGTCQMVLLRLAHDEITRLYALSDPTSGVHEKNWMPISGRDDLTFVRSCHPTAVWRFDIASERLEEIVCHAAPPIARSFRGGSHAIPVPGGLLAVVHEAVQSETRYRVYLHRFVFLNDALAIRAVSPQFFFLDRGIEYCAGLARHDDVLTASFGYRDQEALLATLSLAEVMATMSAV